MHELSIMSNILDIVMEYATKNGAKKVAKVYLQVGDLSDLLPEWMQMYFDFVSKDTIADKAELVIERVPAVLKCKKCLNEFTMNRENWQFTCPKCNETDVEIISGREFKILSIEVE